MKYRKEQDSFGMVQVPENVYYGAQTQRALENFPFSNLRLPPVFIISIALIKKHAAKVNADLGILPRPLSEAIITAAQEIIEGKLKNEFVVDVFQTGSGTSTHMNVNEVIASRANEIITGKKAPNHPVHPNDHVNAGQSSNDVIPSAICIAALTSIEGHLLPSLQKLHKCLEQKAAEFSEVMKIGRTHLQDAVPISLGDEFSGYARQIELGIEQIKGVKGRLSELALGGTAVGSGINTHPEFPSRVISLISRETRCDFLEAKNHFEAQASQNRAVETSGVLKTIAISMMKIANDIRWLASGPKCGIGEINIPALQSGSSLMPGKINPVIPEAVLQIGAYIIGCDTVIAFGGQAGNFELNTMLPLIAYKLLQSVELLGNTASIFAEKCIKGITANRKQCDLGVENSLASGVLLVPIIGYDRASAVVREAYERNMTIKEVVSEKKIVSEEELKRLI